MTAPIVRATLANDEDRAVLELDLDARHVAAVGAEVRGRRHELEGRGCQRGRGRRIVRSAREHRSLGVEHDGRRDLGRELHQLAQRLGRIHSSRR